MGCEARGSWGGGGGNSPSMNTVNAALLLPAFTSHTKSHNGVLWRFGWLRQLLEMLRAMWGVQTMVCVCVYGGSVGSWLKHHTANLHVPSPRPASGHTKGMMSCLANNKRVWVRQALLSNPASSSFIQPSINRKPYPLYWGWGMDNNKAGMGQH